MRDPKQKEALLKECLKVISYSSDRIVIQAEAEGAQLILYIAGLLLAVFGVGSLVASFSPGAVNEGMRNTFLSIAVIGIAGGGISALIAYKLLSPPEVIFQQGGNHVRIQHGDQTEMLAFSDTSLDVIRFAAKSGLHMTSLLLHLDTHSTLALATSTSEKMELLLQIVMILKDFTQSKG